MSDRIDDGEQTESKASGGDRRPEDLQRDSLQRQAPTGGRDDTIDEDLEQERLDPGLNAGGDGEAGADPSSTHSHGNSNT